MLPLYWAKSTNCSNLVLAPLHLLSCTSINRCRRKPLLIVLSLMSCSSVDGCGLLYCTDVLVTSKSFQHHWGHMPIVEPRVSSVWYQSGIVCCFFNSIWWRRSKVWGMLCLLPARISNPRSWEFCLFYFAWHLWISFKEMHGIQNNADMIFQLNKDKSRWSLFTQEFKTALFFFSFFFLMYRDDDGLNVTGRFYPPIGVEGVAHDMVLECLWKCSGKLMWKCLLFVEVLSYETPSTHFFRKHMELFLESIWIFVANAKVLPT